MLSEENSPVRINTRISARTNAWLDEKCKEMAISKSALVAVAIENYIKEIEVVHGLPKILEQLQKQGIKL